MIADREKRLERLVEANAAIGSEASLDDVLQKTVEVAAGSSQRASRRSGSSIEPGHTSTASSRHGSTRRQELAPAIFLATTRFSAFSFAKHARSVLPT
jgi:hypothetical protein